ncbi:tyrosine recombinase XerC [Acutalibacter caecimuris]|uniref:tyrosine recombinase XerC n=1 Tax=Acutalibacter caecimuris TaxID=3093657 RepID=UPI002AC8C14E|nr:tyrosine recombinase XerC [Acutalibacter sp. M00118]
MGFSIRDEMPELVQQYAMYLRNIKGLSAKTVDSYCMDLRTFFRFMNHKRNPALSNIALEEISVQDIDLTFIREIKTYDIFEFMNYVADERNNMSSTRQRKSSALKSFFKYLTLHENLLEENPTDNLTPPKAKKALPHFLSLEQSIELLNAPEGPDQERDRCMLTLFLNCGMRLSELVSINISDVLRNNNTLRILGKGNKERIVYLNQACLDSIDSYLMVRPKDGVIDRNALFLSSRKQRISPKTVQFVVKKYLNKIGLGGPGYSVHKLRHTAATLMYRYGDVDIRVLQDILGHENLGTTEIYTHTSNQQMEDAINSNPLAKVVTHTKPPKNAKE